MKKRFIFLLFAFFSLSAHSQIITTIAGNGTAGFSGDGGPAVHAEVAYPIGVAVDGNGNVYISEYDSNRVRKVTTDGIITTVAGIGIAGYNGDNIAATAAMLNSPWGLAVDKAGNLYICDQDNNRVRKVNPAGIITTFAGGISGGYIGEGNGGPATAAELSWPINITLDKYGNSYITESGDALIRKVDTFGIITIVAGTGIEYYSSDGGQATATDLDAPYGAAVDNAGNIYIAEDNGNRIRKVNTAGIISTVAGTGIGGYSGDGGPATAADIRAVDVVVDGIGNLFICDAAFSRIRKVNTAGIITTVAGGGTALGDGGPAVDCQLNYPSTMALDAAGDMYIADSHNNRVRRVDSVANPLNVVNMLAGTIAVYPNPSQGRFIVNISSNTNEHAQFTIVNIAGEKVEELTLITNRPENISLDVPSGIYFMSAVTASEVYNKELIVSR